MTLIVQDWGGPIGGRFAYCYPDRVKRLVVMNGMVGGRPPAGTPALVDYPWVAWIRSDAFEPTITNLSATVLSVMKRIGFEKTAHVDETWVRASASPFPTPADCKGAGPVVMALRSQATIIPLVTHGGREVMPRGEWRIRSGHIEVHLLKAIPTRGLTYDDQDAVLERLHALAERELAGAHWQTMQ